MYSIKKALKYVYAKFGLAPMWIIIVLILSNFLRIGIVPSDSMLNTYPVGTIHLIYTKATIFEHGDIIVFHHNDVVCCKRIIAMEGDSIAISDGYTVLNNTLIDEPYAIHDHSQYFREVVPNNSFFVMGDNRSCSEDSRYWGYLPKDKVVGKDILYLTPKMYISVILLATLIYFIYSFWKKKRSH